jgi:regulator of protease activity HflC (stomatin/prohibitin superfamily)
MSDTPQKLIVDVEKGTHEDIDLTPAEIAERDQMAAQAEVERQEREAAEQAKADAKLRAQAKLQALGLTGEEIVALG